MASGRRPSPSCGAPLSTCQPVPGRTEERSRRTQHRRRGPGQKQLQHALLPFGLWLRRVRRVPRVRRVQRLLQQMSSSWQHTTLLPRLRLIGEGGVEAADLQLSDLQNAPLR
jgi:hypothetical protein